MGDGMKAVGLTVAAGLAALAFGALARAQAPDEAPPPGKAVYETYCAACHQAPEEGSRAAPLASLRKMSAPTLMSALTTGVMKPMGEPNVTRRRGTQGVFFAQCLIPRRLRRIRSSLNTSPTRTAPSAVRPSR